MNAPRKISFLVLIPIGAVAVFMIVILSGRVTWFSEQPPLEFNPNMDHNRKAITQSANGFFSDGASQRPPVEGTVGRTQVVYPLGMGDVDEAEVQNVDPMLEQTEFLLARGQNRFNVFCSPCHYYNGQSEMSAVSQKGWPGIPNLTRPETQALSNARIFHIISAGQNLMPKYADKIAPIDRWAIIYYLRTLQAAAGTVAVADTTAPAQVN